MGNNVFFRSDLTGILPSKRSNLIYLEKCKVMQSDNRIVYVTESKKASDYYNIPIANTIAVILGTGTSITNAAVRMLAQAGVVIGFAGGGGTPLISSCEIEWITPQNEYRITKYMQKWCQMWFDDDKRLETAKFFQRERCDYLEKIWSKDDDLKEYGFTPDNYELSDIVESFRFSIENAYDTKNLLLAEAAFYKSLYKFAGDCVEWPYFTRAERGQGTDLYNQFLDHGFYLAYGLAASALWMLGISHSFAVMHGKTRRGALVFDVADLVKETVILPFAFICAKKEISQKEHRDLCIKKFVEHKCLDHMYDVIKRSICMS